ncbi:hypothetical protein [Glaesserella parasuis]|uniref:hypothetical protein n=2 Tax=Glaesserella parasuis TaxID=738 RepID=UPI003F2FF078
MVSAIKAAVIDIEKRVVAINAYRKEASRLVSLANKRVQRLELNGLTDSPAYKAYIASGGKFGVRGKSHNELQQEVARLNRFINSTTSTIKGVNKTLKEMADNTGITYRDLKELRAKSSKFFELANKVEQYLRTVDDMASAIGYQKIWETINTYVKRGDIDLGDADNDVDNMVDVVTKAIKEYERPDVNQFSNWYKIRED